MEWYKVIGKKKKDKLIYSKTATDNKSFDYSFKAQKGIHEGLYYAKIFYKSEEDREVDPRVITNRARITVTPDPDFQLRVDADIKNCSFEESFLNLFDEIDQVAQNDDLLLTLDVSKGNINSENKSGDFVVNLPSRVTVKSNNVFINGKIVSDPDKIQISDDNDDKVKKLRISDLNLYDDDHKKIEIYFKMGQIPEESQSFTITSKFIHSGRLYSDESSSIKMNFVLNEFIIHHSDLSFGKISAFSEMLELLVKKDDQQNELFFAEDHRRIKGRANLSVSLFDDFYLYNGKQKVSDNKLMAFLRYYDRKDSRNFKTIGSKPLYLAHSDRGQFEPRILKDQLRLFIQKSPLKAGSFHGTIQWTLRDIDSV